MQTSKQQIIQDFIKEVKSFNRFNPEANYAEGLTKRDVELVGLLNIVLNRIPSPTGSRIKRSYASTKSVSVYEATH